MKMNMKRNQKDRIRSWRIVVLIIYFVSIFILQSIIKKNLFDPSISYLKEINNGKTYSEGVIKFFVIITYFTTITPYLILLSLIYNFTNIYKSFILLMVILNSYLFGGLIKLILEEPRPFLSDKDITNHNFTCRIGFGNPSGHSLSGTAFYLTLWHIIFQSSKLKKKALLKYLSLCFLILFLLFVYFARFISGANSLDQLLFGMFIGLGIYIGIFHVLNANVNDGIQFYTFMNIRNLIFFTINFLIFLAALLVYIFVQDGDILLTWLANAKQNANKDCVSAAESQNIFKQEGFLMIGVFLSNFGAFLGLKFEYYYVFNANTQNWNQYNFEKIEKTDDSLLSKIGDHEMQWNHTSIMKSIIRLVVILCLSMVMLLPFILVSDDQTIILVFLFKFLSPIGLLAFSMFYLYKVIVQKFKLDNNTVFILMQE